MTNIAGLPREYLFIAGIFILMLMLDVYLFVNVLAKHASFYKCLNKKPEYKRIFIPIGMSEIYRLDKISLGIAVKLNMATKLFISFLLLSCIFGSFLLLMIKSKM